MMIRYRKRSDGLYVALEQYRYFSPRYRRWVRIKKDQVRNGANWAIDIESDSWWVHDQLCADGHWEDGTLVSAWQAATVLADILNSEGRYFRAIYWRFFTLIGGCDKPRRNGWFRV